MTAANSNQRENQTIFTSTRFGNVLGSRGSVIPIFREQIKKGGPLTLTDPEMTRFIMSIEEAVHLVIDSAHLSRGGEVFVTKMPVIRIKDLAEVMIAELSAEYGYEPQEIIIETIGAKPGEKMYEELMSQEETRRSWELEKYFTVKPAFSGLYNNIQYNYPKIFSKEVKNPYNSANEKPLSKDSLLAFLSENNLLHENITKNQHPNERYWPNGTCSLNPKNKENDNKQISLTSKDELLN